MAEKKKYYWMKFHKDFFSSLRVKRLRKFGDTYIVIYLKMQLLSISTEGHLSYKGIFESFAEEIAEDIDEDTDKVEFTIKFLLDNDLLVKEGDDYLLPYASENIGFDTADAIRMREMRARKRTESEQCSNNVLNLNTFGYGEIEIDKEKDIDKRKRNKFNRYQQSEYDFDAIEKALTKGK